MPDNMDVIWSKFFDQRKKTLWERFPGQYRAIVVETNDPLNMYRVRFKCPDLHDFDLEPQDCPWAVPANDLGGYRSGRFAHPCIGDWILITFERQHPYAPIWIGFANPTRRKAYTYPQVFQQTPLPVNEDGKPTQIPSDYDVEYLPKDGRPMAHGWQDKYGNIELHSSVGYYPKTHDVIPPPADHDALQNVDFAQRQLKPEVNNPDKKYIANITKYGNMIILGDQGYSWKKDGEFGEFTGGFEEDEQFEIFRWLYLQKLINEDKPKSEENGEPTGGDQRKALIMTRYGHRIECRDVGWAQQGPIPSKSRLGEYGEERILSRELESDQRWIKIRTKGGMLFQAYDKGFHPADDEYIKRRLIEEQGFKSENEDEHWKDKDARWIRTVTRHGFKIVLDDRGSSNTAAHTEELPRGNGILIKGRRSPSSKNDPKTGDQRGYHIEFNENDAANHMTFITPLGNTIEMNDRYQYTMLASMGSAWTPPWKNLAENEFIRKPTMMGNPEANSHHLKIDYENEYIRLKTRAGGGQGPDKPSNPTGVEQSELNQGLEARDGSNGDGPWLELVDCQNRGMWWSKKYNIGIWRAKREKNMYMWIDEDKDNITIYNKDGKTIIYAKDIEIIAENNLSIQAGNKIDMKANKINMQAGSTKYTIRNGRIITNADLKCNSVAGFIAGVRPGAGAGSPQGNSAPAISKIKIPDVPEHIEPTDRGKTYNGAFEECPIEEVEHQLEVD